MASSRTTAGETFAPLTLGQRLAAFFVSWLGYLAIGLIGLTLRWEVSIEEGGPPDERFPGIYAVWHRCIFPGVYWYRHRGLAVMTSSSVDGEFIARVLERFGYLAVRGSSSRGGVRALLGMHKVIEAGHSVVFTADGPRGPRYVAKPGPVLLARNTGLPIYCFYVALERAWVLNSWDGFMIPKPFSRALLKVGALIPVPSGIAGDALAGYQEQMQATLDRIRVSAEEQVRSRTRSNV